MLDWLQHTTPGLLILAALSVAVLLLLIIKVKLEPFIALIVVGVVVALVGGLSITDLVGTPIKSADALIEKGFAGILGHIAPIIGLGTVLGAIMERSGGADVLASRLLKLFGEKGARSRWASPASSWASPSSSTSASSCSPARVRLGQARRPLAGALRDADARRPVDDPRVPATAPRPRHRGGLAARGHAGSSSWA